MTVVRHWRHPASLVPSARRLKAVAPAGGDDDSIVGRDEQRGPLVVTFDRGGARVTRGAMDEAHRAASPHTKAEDDEARAAEFGGSPLRGSFSERSSRGRERSRGGRPAEPARPPLHDGRRVAVECRELDLERLSVFVDMHDGPFVAALQAFLGDRRRDDDSVEFFDHGRSFSKRELGKRT